MSKQWRTLWFDWQWNFCDDQDFQEMNIRYSRAVSWLLKDI
jgi:hypothetical protein